MKFKNAFQALLEEKEWSLPKLADEIGVRPSTPYFWIKGRSVPGRKRLEDLFEALKVDEETRREMRELRDAHTPPRQTTPKHAKRESEFSALLTEVLSKRKNSLYELADLAGVTRMSMYSWMWGKAIPSPKKLDDLLAALDCGQGKRDKLAALCEEARKANPRPRGYSKRSIWEREVITRLLERLDLDGAKTEKFDSPCFDFSFSSSRNGAMNQNIITLAARRTVSRVDSIFMHACEAKRMVLAKFAVIVVPKVEPHTYEDLFAHHCIYLVTEAGFYERNWFGGRDCFKSI
jgi:transcriptional regulator with XRE-family HTH domain